MLIQLQLCVTLTSCFQGLPCSPQDRLFGSLTVKMWSRGRIFICLRCPETIDPKSCRIMPLCLCLLQEGGICSLVAEIYSKYNIQFQIYSKIIQIISLNRFWICLNLLKIWIKYQLSYYRDIKYRICFVMTQFLAHAKKHPSDLVQMSVKYITDHALGQNIPAPLSLQTLYFSP